MSERFRPTLRPKQEYFTPAHIVRGAVIDYDSKQWEVNGLQNEVVFLSGQDAKTGGLRHAQPSISDVVRAMNRRR